MGEKWQNQSIFKHLLSQPPNPTDENKLQRQPQPRNKKRHLRLDLAQNSVVRYHINVDRQVRNEHQNDADRHRLPPFRLPKSQTKQDFGDATEKNKHVGRGKIRRHDVPKKFGLRQMQNADINQTNRPQPNTVLFDALHKI